MCEVVVPAYGAQHLDGCLSALADMRVCVVDDASADRAGVTTAVASNGARVIRLDCNRGPAAARNVGLRETQSPYVAFVDSDVRVDSAAVAALIAHFDDPEVAAVAPRIRPLPAPAHDGVLSRFAEFRSPLDLGDRPAHVRPGARIGYVPSTVLVVRRSAIEDVGGFDESLRFGEDVDLVWRLTAAGWSVRYQPDVVAHHSEPLDWASWLRRRANYGTSAAALLRRHRDVGDALRPPILPLATVAAVATGHRRIATLTAAVAVAAQWRRWRSTQLPMSASATRATRDVAVGLVATARWMTQAWWPLLLTGSLQRRAGVAAVALTPALVDHMHERPGLDVARWSLAAGADDVAYGIGIWIGCARERTLRPLLPRFTGLTSTRNFARGLLGHARTSSRQPE